MSVATSSPLETLQSTRDALSKQYRSRHTMGQLGRLLALFALLVSGIVYVVVPLVAIGVPFVTEGWTQRPFIGTFVDHSLRVNTVQPTTMTHFTGLDAGLTSSDRIVAVDDLALTSAIQLNDYVGGRSVGDTVRLQVASDDGAMRQVDVQLMRLPVGDVFSRFVMPYLTGLVYLAVGLWIYRARREQTSARAFLLMCATTALAVGLVFDLWTTQVFRRLWTASVPLAAAATFELGLVFPVEARWLKRSQFWRLLPYAFVVPVILWGQFFLDATPDSYQTVREVGYFAAAFATLALVATMFFRGARAASPVAREQARVVLVGSALAFVPFAAWVFAPPNTIDVEWVLGAFVVFPMAVGYAILRSRILDSERLASTATSYLLLGVLVALGHTLLVAGASLVVGYAVSATNPILVSVIIFVTLLVFDPVRKRLQASIDGLFFRSRQVYETRLQGLSQALTLAGELRDVVRVLTQQIQETIHPTHMYVFLRSQDGEEYVAPRIGTGEAKSDVRFRADGALANALAASSNNIYLEAGQPLPAELEDDRTLLAVLRAPVLAPLTSQSRLIGWLAIGPKRSGEAFNVSDLRFVESLSRQAALAVERAQVVSDLRHRVQELDVLSQVSQAANFTLDFDSLLELIYAQASKVIRATNFYIILHEPKTDSLRYAFFLEGDERLPDREGEAWPEAIGLAGEVVRTGHPIRTDAYVAECERRGVEPINPGFHAWMGVPLNISANTLGVMAVASYRLGDTFNDEQLKVFWSIGDQAASALEKARLFSDAEKRARQLATLNQISSTLASTLDLERLLSLIMKAAVDILGAEAGSLLLVEQETGQLEFRVLEGGALELVGQRLDPGVGLVGAVAETGKPIIVNDVKSDPRWFASTDQDTGFMTESIIAVPLQLQDTVLGVLELLNKADGTDYTDEDLTLLTTFASQASVAIGNARLYQATDQELTERVDELSMLQRIDRELNTTLEVDRVIQITLDWALRVSGASSGAVGIVDEERGGLLILASQGQDEAFDEHREDIMSITPGSVLARVVDSGKPELVTDVSAESGYGPINSAASSLMSVPILRVNEVIGVLLLESNIAEVLTLEDLDFINRLTEHASVAISNARLFQEVEEANRAKTEFISFVSHELKTPMTSIKGYTDLLLSGQVGDITEMQLQFLETVRSNVDRMSRLVSDLTDVSRIESGHLRLDMAPVPFTLVLEETLTSMQRQIEAKEQTLHVEIPEDLPLVMADQTRMVQVLTNLLSNATKYTAEGGEISVSAAQKQVPNGSDGPVEVIEIAVRDNGLGMSPEDLEQLFTKFFRSDSVKGSVPGTGLGLNITKNLIEMHGGQIWVKSMPGEGTTFTYIIPVHRVNNGGAAGG